MNQKIDDGIIISANDLQEMYTYVNLSHALHLDMRGHTGVVSNVGIGVLTSNLSKQKMNSISSNKSEVIGNSEYLTYKIWCEYFLESQGYPMKTNILWQYSEAVEEMAKYRKMPCSSKYIHIVIKFFWVTNKAKQEAISIKHCPINKMLAYFIAKPSQVSKFNFFRRVIMGWDDVPTLWDESDDKGKVSSTSKERVEDTGNNVDVCDGHTDMHADARNWSGVVIRGTIGGSNVQP